MSAAIISHLTTYSLDKLSQFTTVTLILAFLSSVVNENVWHRHFRAISALPLSNDSRRDHRPSQSSMCTAQLVLNASVAHILSSFLTLRKPLSMAQARGVLAGSTPGNCQLFPLLLLLPHNIQIHLFPVWGMMLSAFRVHVTQTNSVQKLIQWSISSVQSSKPIHNPFQWLDTTHHFVL